MQSVFLCKSNEKHKQFVSRAVSAFGVPDDRMGEELAVWIRLRRPDSVSEHDIRSYCKGRIARRASEEELKKRLETLNATLDGFMEANDAYVEKVQEVCELEEAEEYATRLTAVGTARRDGEKN
ncbi:putative acyl-CoA synthetase YngI [Amphibalanus amphitrite]|uniref:Putative acyl-CoA synthetase YngI n=1 Tax=Amphibalanus amphitrite TaxID=1232801 RepID=A0A6A4V1B3_AMPAM|nr:putative acyl-CoA synthetase YngI [Amphibalanus amphitrite]